MRAIAACGLFYGANTTPVNSQGKSAPMHTDQRWSLVTRWTRWNIAFCCPHEYVCSKLNVYQETISTALIHLQDQRLLFLNMWGSSTNWVSFYRENEAQLNWCKTWFDLGVTMTLHHSWVWYWFLVIRPNKYVCKLFFFLICPSGSWSSISIHSKFLPSLWPVSGLPTALEGNLWHLAKRSSDMLPARHSLCVSAVWCRAVSTWWVYQGLFTKNCYNML